MQYYKLVKDKIERAKFNEIERPSQPLIQSNITIYDKEYQVSTIFLSINHGITSLVLFETMVFNEGENVDYFTERYISFDSAIKGHNETIIKLVEYIKEKDSNDE